jgi:hypothetical protein
MAFTRGISPLEPPPHCGCGRMVRGTGYSKKSGKYFAAFFCRAETCPPRWVDVDSIILEALAVWKGFEADLDTESEDSNAA